MDTSAQRDVCFWIFLFFPFHIDLFRIAEEMTPSMAQLFQTILLLGCGKLKGNILCQSTDFCCLLVSTFLSKTESIPAILVWQPGKIMIINWGIFVSTFGRTLTLCRCRDFVFGKFGLWDRGALSCVILQRIVWAIYPGPTNSKNEQSRVNITRVVFLCLALVKVGTVEAACLWRRSSSYLWSFLAPRLFFPFLVLNDMKCEGPCCFCFAAFEKGAK